jgi:hypothetical protein
MKVLKILQQLGKQMLRVWDTRFDRVATILEKDTLDFIAQFKDSTVQLLLEVRGQRMKISL